MNYLNLTDPMLISYPPRSKRKGYLTPFSSKVAWPFILKLHFHFLMLVTIFLKKYRFFRKADVTQFDERKFSEIPYF